MGDLLQSGSPIVFLFLFAEQGLIVGREEGPHRHGRQGDIKGGGRRLAENGEGQKHADEGGDGIVGTVFYAPAYRAKWEMSRGRRHLGKRIFIPRTRFSSDDFPSPSCQIENFVLY